MRNGDELEELLDEALVTYTDAEPLDGLPSRVLRRVRDKRRSARSVGWIEATGVTAAAGLLAFAITMHRWNMNKPVIHEPEQESPVLVANIALPEITFALAGRSRQSKATLPKQPLFPAVPVSQEERALLRVLNTAANPIPQFRDSADLIAVAPVEVAPIVTDDNEKSNEETKP
jgi:hypothetical protein